MLTLAVVVGKSVVAVETLEASIQSNNMYMSRPFYEHAVVLAFAAHSQPSCRLKCGDA